MLTYIGLIVAAYATVRLGGLTDEAADQDKTGRAVWYFLGVLAVVVLTGLMLADLGTTMNEMQSMPY